MRRSLIGRLARVRWVYARPTTTVAVLVVAGIGSLLAWAVLPRAWRPESLGWLVAATVVAYAVLRLDAYAGVGKRFKHALMDSFGGDVDDAQTWAVAAAAGGGLLLVVALLERWIG